MLPQESERQAVETQTQLLAFDRQNRMGASDSMAKSIKKAIQEEAEAMLSDKKVVSGAVNIADNAEKMKVIQISAADRRIANDAVSYMDIVLLERYSVVGKMLGNELNAMSQGPLVEAHCICQCCRRF